MCVVWLFTALWIYDMLFWDDDAMIVCLDVC